MQVEMWDIDAVKPYANNPRKNDAAVEAVARSIQAYGVRQPLVVDEDGVLIVGHTRLLALKRLGYKTVPVHVAKGLTEAEARGYRLADNATSTLSTWDDDKLVEELTKLQQDNFDLSLTGFDDDQLKNYLDADTALFGDPDDVPPVPADPVTKPGDLIVLGDHRLLCGDATNPTDVARVLDGRTPFMLVSDPPYGVEYSPEWRKEAGVNDSERMGKVANDDRVDWTEAYRLFPGDVCYLWHASYFTIDVGLNLRQAGFEIRASIIWKKQSLVLSRGHYHWQHEPCWYGVRKGRTARWCGDRSQSTVWDVARNDGTGETVHGTQKPVECMARPIRNHGQKGDDVYDPFLGSGTTLIACEQLGRKCLGLEIDPRYCDVIVSRFENVTGKSADRVGRGG